MKKSVIGLGVAAGILLLTFFWGVGTNNSLVTLDESIRSHWAQVEVVLQRRYDLIPNYVNTVKGYAAHEKEILEEVSRLRSQWSAAGTVGEKAAAANQLEGSLARLLVVVERYPELKADQNFRDLQHELAGTENRIAVERKRYNDSIQAYNTVVRKFPASIVASMRGFVPNEDYFESAAAAQEAPKVDFTP